MGTLFSGVGLASGLDYQNIISQLIAIESRPRDQIVARIGAVNAQKTALLDISARVSAMLSRISALTSASAFRTFQATSSNPGALAVTTSESVAPGSYDFVVRQLASTHQLVSRGFSSGDARLGSGTVRIESAQARVNRATSLDELNGLRGVQRGGRFELRDAGGGTAQVDISDAATLNDVVDRINGAGLAIRAEISGDRLVLTESSGGAITVREVDGRHVAADLGFGPGRTTTTTGRIEGETLVRLDATTRLSALRDGLGIRSNRAGADFSVNGVNVELSDILKTDTRLERLNHGAGVALGRIRVVTTNAAGVDSTQEVDLSTARTIGDVKSAIEGAVEGVTVTLSGSGLTIARTGGATEPLRIEDVSGTAARDLGIAASGASGRVTGRKVLFNDTMSDVIAAINFASGNDGSVQARIEGTRIAIGSTSGSVTLAALNNSNALTDLGFAAGSTTGEASGARLIAGVNSVLLQTLNGGRGVQSGAIRIQAGGADVTLDLSAAESLSDVVNLLNEVSSAEGMGFSAGFDSTGTRLMITSDDGLTPVTISDVNGGTAAAQLGIAGSGARIDGGNLNRQYISERSLLADLNGGRGVGLGKIRVTNSNGLARTIDLSGSEITTLGDVIARINADTALGVTARINDSGDGLLLEDAAGGPNALKVADEGGTLAKDLRIAGDFSDGRADGSFEMTFEIQPGESLSEFVTRLNAAGGLATARLINDGSGTNPVRLQLTSGRSGEAGALLVDGDALGLDFTTLTRAQDAKVVLGSDASGGIVLSSSTNTLTNVVPGMTIDLLGVSEGPVSVNVNQDLTPVIKALEGFATAYNEAVTRIRELSKYDPETQEAGILLGDRTTRAVERRLFEAVSAMVPGVTGTYRRLSQVGLKLESGELKFDEAVFRREYEANPELVGDFFTNAVTGAAKHIEARFKEITQDGGMIDRETDTLTNQTDLLSERVELLSGRLSRKQERLTRQFLALERALAQLQGQQSSLNSLGALLGSSGQG